MTAALCADVDERLRAIAFGAVIEALREKRRLSQVQLAMQIETSQAHISRLERGERECTLAQARRLADALRVPLDQIDQRVSEALRLSVLAADAIKPGALYGSTDPSGVIRFAVAYAMRGGCG